MRSELVDQDCLALLLLGRANQVGKTADGLALWALRVKGADIPGRFIIIVDGAFVELKAEPG
jgi:hypothetical protein